MLAVLAAQGRFCFCFGLAVNSFGIALITRSGLGATQISSLPYVWSLATPAVSYALATFIVNMGFFAVEAILVGRKFFPLQLFQVVASKGSAGSNPAAVAAKPASAITGASGPCTTRHH